MNIKHWEQYLTPLGKTKLNLHPDSFDNVLKWDRIILPVFQRKYCWTKTQLSRYWNDLLYVALNMGDAGHRKHRRRHDNAHSLGKIITFERTVTVPADDTNKEDKKINQITVIDGQQRLTTTIIILITMFHLLTELKKSSSKNKKDEVVTNKNIRKKIEKTLFMQKPSVVKNISYEAGDSLHEYIRFIPTFLDRFYFYNILLKPKECIQSMDDIIEEFEKEQAEKNAQNKDEAVNAGMGDEQDEDEEMSAVNNVPNSVNSNEIILHKNFNHLYYAFHYFNKELRKFVSDPMKIKLLYANLLTQFKFVYVGIPHDSVNVEQQHSIYQWFFERELFIEQAGGDRPGYSQTVCDLFRNYVLSFFITMNMDQQKRIYKLWLDTETSFLNILEYNSYLIDIIEISHNAPYKPYDFYRKFVQLIESNLIQYQKLDYQLYIEQLLINLNKKKQHDCYLSLVHGYFRQFGKQQQQAKNSSGDGNNKTQNKNNDSFEGLWNNDAISKLVVKCLYDRSSMLVNAIDYTNLQLSHMRVKKGIQSGANESKVNNDDQNGDGNGGSQENSGGGQSDASKGKEITVIDVKKPRKLSEINEDGDDSGNW